MIGRLSLLKSPGGSHRLRNMRMFSIGAGRRSERVRCCEFRKDQLIVEPLMVPLMMVVDDELLNGTA